MLAPWKKSCDQPRQHIQKQRHQFANKGLSSQSYGFSSGHVWMWELDYKESPALENWCFWTVVLEKTLESPLDFKEIKPVHPKGNQSRLFIGRTDVAAETPILWPPDAKNWLNEKDPDAGRQEEKARGEGMTEDENVGWHHWLNGHGFELTPGIGDGQGGLACCSLWGHKELEMTEWLNWTELRRRLCFLLHNRCSIILTNIYQAPIMCSINYYCLWTYRLTSEVLWVWFQTTALKWTLH